MTKSQNKSKKAIVWGANKRGPNRVGSSDGRARIGGETFPVSNWSQEGFLATGYTGNSCTGDRVEIEFNLANAEINFMCQAEVVRAYAAAQVIACKFLNLNGKIRERMAQYIERHTTSVLLVEDDEDDYELACENLHAIERNSFEIEWAPSFEVGLQAVARRDFDVCLVDYHIGAQTGLDFIGEASAAGCLAPMILLTGASDDGVDLAATQAGAADYLEKATLNPRILERSIRYSISEARRRKEKLDLLEVTLDNTGAGIAVFDKDLSLAAWNEHFLEMLGLGGAQAYTASDQRWRPDQITALSRLVTHRFPLKQARQRAQFEYPCGDGRVLQVCQNPIPAGGVVIVCVDISPIKQTEESLCRAKQAAEAADRSKSEFLAAMSHELRTPLNAIIGFSEVLQLKMPPENLDDYCSEYLDHITQSGTNLLNMITDALDISKIDVGDFTLDESYCHPKTIVEASLRMVRERAETAGLDITVDVEPELPELFVDVRLLKKVLVNLLSNSIKFTDQGGHVGLKLCRDGALTIFVSDTGIGIDTENIPRVLARFKQVDGSLARRYEGMGLGLPLAKAFIELHGGVLTLDSSIGVGTTVKVTLPAERLAAPSTAMEDVAVATAG